MSRNLKKIISFIISISVVISINSGFCIHADEIIQESESIESDISESVKDTSLESNSDSSEETVETSPQDISLVDETDISDIENVIESENNESVNNTVNKDEESAIGSNDEKSNVEQNNDIESGQQPEKSDDIIKDNLETVKSESDNITDVVIEPLKTDNITETKESQIGTVESTAENSLAITKPIPLENVEVESTDPISLSNDFAYIFGRTNTLIAPEEKLLRGEACSMLYRLLKQNSATGDFTFDINDKPIFPKTLGRWDRSAAEYMNYIGIYTETRLSPRLSEKISRVETFKLFDICLGMTDETNLTDEQYAKILVNRGYVEGDEHGDLKLYDNISRAEFCKIYNLITGRSQMPLVDALGNEITVETYGFEDVDPNSWYCGDILRATSAYTNNAVDLDKRIMRNEVDDY